MDELEEKANIIRDEVVKRIPWGRIEGPVFRSEIRNAVYHGIRAGLDQTSVNWSKGKADDA